jgi:hypothetical protein
MGVRKLNLWLNLQLSEEFMLHRLQKMNLLHGCVRIILSKHPFQPKNSTRTEEDMLGLVVPSALW